MTHYCDCYPGWTNKLGDSGLKCDKDIDECEVEDVCGFGKCFNFPGLHICSCLPGYVNFEGHPYQPCVDIDECELYDGEESICKNGECRNLNGTYECECYPGSISSDKLCIPVEDTAGDINIEMQMPVQVIYVPVYRDPSSEEALLLWERTKGPLVTALKKNIPGLKDLKFIRIDEGPPVDIKYELIIDPVEANNVTSSDSSEFKNVDINDLLNDPTSFAESVVSDDSFKDTLSVELEENCKVACDLIEIKLNKTVNPVATKIEIDEEKLFQDYCNKKCSQNEILIHTG